MHEYWCPIHVALLPFSTFLSPFMIYSRFGFGWRCIQCVSAVCEQLGLIAGPAPLRPPRLMKEVRWCDAPYFDIRQVMTVYFFLVPQRYAWTGLSLQRMLSCVRPCILFNTPQLGSEYVIAVILSVDCSQGGASYWCWSIRFPTAQPTAVVSFAYH